MTRASQGLRGRRGPERGAILIQVAIASVVLIAFSMFVVDYGMHWVSRRQAQNAADAGALAGAVALAFDDFSDRSETGPAKTAARTFAVSNTVWGEAPEVDIVTDVTFPPCPDDGSNTCIRVDVYRNQERANPLPSWFGQLVGVTDHGVRATATAQAAGANASDCLKPFMIPDKWWEFHPVEKPWDVDDTFDQHDGRGNPVPNPDIYEAPTSSSPGSGFTLAADLGRLIELKAGSPQDAIAPGNYYPVRLPMPDGSEASGANDYRWNIANCNGVPIQIGGTLENEPGNMVGPTKQGMQDLIDLDPGATWNAAEKKVENSCAQSANPCAPRSPRIVAIPVFDTGVFYDGKINGRVTLTIANILGFFVDEMQGNTVRGYFTTIPGLTVGGGTLNPDSSFMSSVTLVR